MNILVLCTGNSARSILLESLLNRLGTGGFTAYSAGSQPTGRVHPQSIELLGALGHDFANTRSKSWDEFATPSAPPMDIVITVCGSAAGETCPIWPRKSGQAPLQTHWGVDDPAAAPPQTQAQAFQTAYDILERRARALLALPQENITKTALDQIGTMP